jgi:hypothetical protein
MDLVNAAVGIKHASIMSQVQARVAKKIMDVEEMNGAAALKLLEAARVGAEQAGENLGSAVSHLGNQLDVLG